ncbi:PLP-dependent aminotransferase family protein [Levilactobacillus zymae]|uniref:Transcriptional regulator, GntR family domain / Aspartate aminotransferase n=1 Tax=Levilactobacillus zymae TaxID=267363 RepID=A0A1Y6JXM9_9LACO|nr:PLP-dependent aminotransferase family protein [Levilactobacillus zymae]SMS14696.1 Transcriptional regulator, GntR family domain / Aspartate aminotransferase [Levilactobacillus zymae]
MAQTVHFRWQPQRESSTPLYQQLITYCVTQIRQGNWLVGQQLPPQRELARTYQVNRSTIHAAIAELQALGVVTTAHGRGTRVASNSWSTLLGATPDWQRWVHAGEFSANQPTIQTINQREFATPIRLSTGELGPDLFPRQAVQTAMHQAADQLTTLNYLPARGSLALREALLRRLATWGVQTTPENILITSGSLQALQLITAALLEPGTTVYTAPASYLRSLRVLESVQAKWAPVPVDEQGLAYWQIPVSSQPQLLYTVPTFDNPLGTVMSAQRRQDLLAFAQKYQLPIIEDTAYQELWLDQRPPLPLKAHDTQGNVLYLGTVSKDLAPGLRVGWLVGPQAVVARLADVKMQMDYGASTLSQQTLVNLLTAPDYPQTLQRLRDQLRARREAALASLAATLGDLATWQRPAGGFYLWVQLPAKVDLPRLFQAALAQGVLANPGTVYGARTNAVRLSYAYATPAEFRQGVTVLATLIRDQLSR